MRTEMRRGNELAYVSARTLVHDTATESGRSNRRPAELPIVSGVVYVISSSAQSNEVDV